MRQVDGTTRLVRRSRLVPRRSGFDRLQSGVSDSAPCSVLGRRGLGLQPHRRLSERSSSPQRRTPWSSMPMKWTGLSRRTTTQRSTHSAGDIWFANRWRHSRRVWIPTNSCACIAQRLSAWTASANCVWLMLEAPGSFCATALKFRSVGGVANNSQCGYGGREHLFARTLLPEWECELRVVTRKGLRRCQGLPQTWGLADLCGQSFSWPPTF